MHLIANGTEPCGLRDGHRGKHRTIAGAAREAARLAGPIVRAHKERWENAHPVNAYLRRLKSRRRLQGVAA